MGAAIRPGGRAGEEVLYQIKRSGGGAVLLGGRRERH